MYKKMVIGGLIALLVGALAVGAYDLIQGDSAMAYRGAENGARFNETVGNGEGNDQGNSSNNAGRGNRGVGQAENAGTGLDKPQASVEEWLTVSGVVESIDSTGMTVEKADGEELVVELGPPSFWSSQGIEIEVGDSVEVLGFYEGESFTVGDIVLTATGEHIMLRNPNGRPLWTGGTSSNQGGHGQGATGEIAQNSLGLVDGSQEPQPQAAVEDWITVQGTVTAVELNALTIETTEGESMLVQLGPEHYWTTQGIVFVAGDEVSITGFYEDEVSFSAGSVTLLATGETLALRDADGRPLWAGGQNANGRGGGGYRGDQAVNE
jgi:hypothetical protein